MIGHDPVAFLGHRPVEGPQAHFPMREGQVAGRRRRERAGEGGVGVAVGQYAVRTRDAELVEEGLGQRVVVVPAGAHDQVFVAAPGELPRDRRKLDEWQRCSDHTEHFHNGVPLSGRVVQAGTALTGVCLRRR